VKILVTGGAGFIGSHIIDKLVEKHEVIVLDNFDLQVHKAKPNYLNEKATYIEGDVRDRHVLSNVLEGCEAVFHEAAVVGVGQSMYQIHKYMDVNTLGTSQLLNILVNEEHDVKKLVVAASMSSYGEGAYKCGNCGIVFPFLRTEEQMKQKKWELICKCGKPLHSIPTKENKYQFANSVYALSKKNQEELCLMVGRTYGIPTTALRYFNVYGPRQSLSNPYTGIAAIFLSRLKNNNIPVVYEDGLQTRDFINVSDIADANIFSLNNPNTDYRVFNVGSGLPISIKSIGETLAAMLGKKIHPQVTETFRKGDVRHCYADITALTSLGWKPTISFETGMRELITWSGTQVADDKFEQATQELKEKGLVE